MWVEYKHTWVVMDAATPSLTNYRYTRHPPLQTKTRTQQALQRYKTQAKGTETSDYEAMQAADAFFSAEAENCIRKGTCLLAEARG